MQLEQFLNLKYGKTSFKKITSTNDKGFLVNTNKEYSIAARVDYKSYLLNSAELTEISKYEPMLAIIPYPCSSKDSLGVIKNIVPEEGDVIDHRGKSYQVTNVKLFDEVTSGGTLAGFYMCDLIDYAYGVSPTPEITKIVNTIHEVLDSFNLEVVYFEDEYNANYFKGKQSFCILDIEETTKLTGYGIQTSTKSTSSGATKTSKTQRMFEVTLRVMHKGIRPNLDSIFTNDELLEGIIDYDTENYLNFTTCTSNATNRTIFNNERYNSDTYLLGVGLTTFNSYDRGVITSIKSEVIVNG